MTPLRLLKHACIIIKSIIINRYIVDWFGSTYVVCGATVKRIR